MELKQNIEKLLKSLSNSGIDRGRIEEDLGYATNSIDQNLARGGTAKFYNALKLYAQNVLPKATSQDKDLAGYVPAEKLIQVLETQNEWMRSTFGKLETNLIAVSTQSASILAHVATSLEKDDERDAKGSKEKLQLLKKDTGRRIGEKLQVHMKKDSHHQPGVSK